MDSNHHKTLWHEAILPFIQSIHEDPLYATNPSFQKRQFVKIHNEIIEFIRQKLNSKYYPDALKKQPYIRELQAL